MNKLRSKNWSRLGRVVWICSILTGLINVGFRLGQAQAAPAPPSAQQQNHMLALWDQALHLSPTQKAKIGPLLMTISVQAQAIYRNQTLSPQVRQTQLDAVWKIGQARIRPLLTKPQQVKLYALQQQGRQSEARRLQSRARMEQALNITSQQKSRMQAIAHQASQQMQAVAANHALAPSQKQAQLQKLRVLTHNRVQQVLTAAQRKKLAAMRADRKPLPAR